MFGHKPTATPTAIGDAATRSIDQALSATRQAANGALDGLGDAAHQLRDDTVPVIDRFSDQAQALARQGLDTVREQSLHLQARARRTSDDTLHYIRDEPVKAVLIAAATGAVLMALAGLLMRPQRGR
jgi:ElaB/YqjD/DUF883 family membrane-anchored ribosome-binding protein